MSFFSFLGGCRLQRTLLYYPERMSMEAVDRFARIADLEPWPSWDKPYMGLIRLDKTVSSRGTVIVFHGNAGAAVHRRYYADALTPRGYRVIISEYPGYGARSGETSEESFVKDASDLVNLVVDEFGGPIYLWGESLGCAVVAGVVSHYGLPVAGVALITPWDTLYNLARAKFPFIPVGLFMRDRYDNAANMQDYPGPVAVLMSERDEIIPVRLTRGLYETLPEPKLLRIFKGAGHNTWPVDADFEWWGEVTSWLEMNAVSR